jgi:cleavage and polyadenylation specificity factor subunit 2
MREHHLDGTVLVRPGASGIYEPLARPDLLITDAQRVLVKNSKRTDRNDVIIGLHSWTCRCLCVLMLHDRYYHISIGFTTLCPHAV